MRVFDRTTLKYFSIYQGESEKDNLLADSLALSPKIRKVDVPGLRGNGNSVLAKI